MKHSRSALFLMELILAILFFSVSGAVCIQLFARSHMLSRQTVNQNHAVIQAQNLAEIFLSSDGDVTRMKSLFSESNHDTPDNMFTILLNAEWEECDSSEVNYIATLTASPQKHGLVEAAIVVYEPGADNNPIYELQIMHHVAERRGNIEK